jgi:hypothetical protein
LPRRARLPDREVGFLPVHVGWHANLFEPRFAFPPADAFQIGRRGSHHVRRGTEEVATTVAVVVDTVVHVVRRQELHLPQLAGPRADHLGGFQVSAVDDAERVEELGAEQGTPSAVPGQRGQRTEDRHLPLRQAEVALERPEGGDDGAGHAVVGIDPLEEFRFGGQLLSCARDAILAWPAASENCRKSCQ